MITFIPKQNIVHDVYTKVGVPFPAGLPSAEPDENEEQNNEPAAPETDDTEEQNDNNEPAEPEQPIEQ